LPNEASLGLVWSWLAIDLYSAEARPRQSSFNDFSVGVRDVKATTSARSDDYRAFTLKDTGEPGPLKSTSDVCNLHGARITKLGVS